MPTETIETYVTVAILTKNAGQLFQEVLLSVLNQSTPWPYEVIVIDSGSTDGTVDFVQNQPGVKLTQIPAQDFGHGRTRNLAMSLAKGKYVAMITHDAKPANNGWLANLVAPFSIDEAVAGVFGRHLPYPTATPYMKRDLELHFNHFLQWPLVLGMDDPQRYANDQGYRQVLHYFSDNNACLKKTVWEKIPYPDVDFAEDQLWAKSMIEAGYKRGYADDAAVYHSHDYGVRDTFRRSYDESRALKKLFGYILCPSVPHGCYQTLACSKRDLNYLRSKGLLRQYFGLAVATPATHLVKQLGFYIGGYQGPLSALFFRLFSLDNSKKRA